MTPHLSPAVRAVRVLAFSAGAVCVMLLSGCASASPDSPASPAFGDVRPAPPAAEVITQGTVLDTGGAAELCLGAIAESYPPQCSGIPLSNWTWEGIDGYESAGDVTWGAYAVQGTYDGSQFTVSTPPIMLALYDPMMLDDPTGGRTGEGDEATLSRAFDEVATVMGEDFLSAYTENGWLWVDVVWDDGTWQDAVDAEYGEGVVIVRSAMRTTEA
ncbi:hypothetical protein [Microbacterium sp. C7(2022)]|uniref:hypothetical protein n=1 Tax=Microbacterium sp. C7(2022) TaxID=2992759 RepID=UPI00237C4544|nr:hypothetical protein [Microbacterium sp. C7(2022)]MDE0547025.1 hypothetical protein [Microbacterium sp. C7(2022)]